MARVGFVVITVLVAQSWCKPYNVYWNIPTNQCKNAFSIDFTFVGKDYGIMMNENDTFMGDKVTILYSAGLFPRIYNYSMSSFVFEKDYSKLYFVNGGIPQKGNLVRHVDELEAQLNKNVPDKRNNGLIIIDMEHFGATWGQNFQDMEIYRIESRLKVRRENPNLSTAEVEAQAKLEYERAADKFLSATLQVVKSDRSYAKIGYYQYPQCFNQPGVDKCSQGAMDDNDQMIRMWKLSDAVFPSLYLANVSTVADRAAMIRGRVREGKRVGEYAKTSLLNLPYISTKYYFTQTNILEADLENLIKIPKEEGADGVVIWGSSYDYNSKEMCSSFKEYVVKSLGPIAKKYISAN